MSDSYDLGRFVRAQASSIDQALAELRAGRKRTHWMWFVFPQLRGLGSSEAAVFYGISSLAEARAYLDHHVLVPRLVDCSQALLAVEAGSARDVLGTPDDLKLRSSMTLFAEAAGGGSVFDAVLNRYFAGMPDPMTMGMLGRQGPDRGLADQAASADVVSDSSVWTSSRQRRSAGNER